jgi:hypothetical protein
MTTPSNSTRFFNRRCERDLSTMNHIVDQTKNALRRAAPITRLNSFPRSRMRERRDQDCHFVNGLALHVSAVAST